MSYEKSFAIGKLYYKYIKNTDLEQAGWTAEKLATQLATHGFIQLLDGPNHGRYIELAGKQLTRRDLLKMYKHTGTLRQYNIFEKLTHKLAAVFLPVLLITGCATTGTYNQAQINALQGLANQWGQGNPYAIPQSPQNRQPATQAPNCYNPSMGMWVPCQGAWGMNQPQR